MREVLAGELRGLRAGLQTAAIKWVAAEKLHLTFRFLGETPKIAVDVITGRLCEACAGFPALEARVAGLGSFPDLARPRVVWVGLQDTSRLEALQRSIELATAEFGESASAGQGRQEAAWIPHLTLGRVKNVPAKESCRLGAQLQRWKPGQLDAWRIDRVVLMESVLSPFGSSYEEVASVALPSS